MDNLKKKFDEREKENKYVFENFLQQNKDNEFMTNMLILRSRFYHYKELLKVYAMNYKSDSFEATRNSMYCFLVVPSLTVLAFNIVSPFSIFKQLMVYSSFGGSAVCFYFSLKDELAMIARKDKTLLGE